MIKYLTERQDKEGYEKSYTQNIEIIHRRTEIYFYLFQ